jgi:hypothetical protein
MPIFSGEESRKLWDEIANVSNGGSYFWPSKVHDALYSMGCKNQELEAQVEKLKSAIAEINAWRDLEKLKEMGRVTSDGYTVTKGSSLGRSELKRIRAMNKDGDNRTTATKAKSFKTKMTPSSKPAPKVSDNARGLIKKSEKAKSSVNPRSVKIG